jgi:hypothetical protein
MQASSTSDRALGPADGKGMAQKLYTLLFCSLVIVICATGVNTFGHSGSRMGRWHGSQD